MFKIIKKGSNNFWHVFNNGAKNVSISNFEVVLDDVLNTFIIVLKNGANIPQIALSVLDIIVIDETGSSVEETYLTASQLRSRLVVLGYTAYLNGSGITELSQLTDVDVSGLTNGQVLVWNSTTNKWEATTIGGLTTPTLQEVALQGDEIINTAGNLKIVLDKEVNGVVLYELVSGTWTERGRYTSSDFQIGNGTGNYYILGSQFTGFSISQGTDIVQLTANSITKNGVEVITEVPYTYIGGEVNFDYIVFVNQIRIKNTGGFLAVLQSDNLTDNRSIQFPDRAITVAGTDEIPTALSQLSTDSANQRVSTTEKSTWNTKQNALGYSAEDSANKSSSYTVSSTTTYANTKALVDGLATKQEKPSFMRLTSAYTGTGSTALQKMFNVGSSGNGSYPATANTTYRFKLVASISGLSSTSGTISFGFLGNANISNITYNSNTIKSASLGTSQQYAFNVATASVLVSGNTATSAKIILEGVFSVSTAGTIIPSFAVSQSTTPSVDVNSFFEITPIGSNTITATSDII
jgi:hypothetical protein